MKGTLRLLYPPQCPGCAQVVAQTDGDGPGALCPDCWREAQFITGICCDACGTPLPGAQDDGDAVLACDDCLGLGRPWAQARAAMVYAGTARRMILALKHGDRPDLAPALAGYLARAAAPLIRPGMIVAPVPLHLRRLMKRRYNQAALLSVGVSRAHCLEHMPDLLVRHRHTPAQDHRSLGERFVNLENALAVRGRRVPALQGRTVLLIDDVMTSGATLATASEVLLQAGAASISVAVLARAVKDA